MERYMLLDRGQGGEEGEMRLRRELEKFVATRLRPYPWNSNACNLVRIEDDFPDVDSRLQEMERNWQEWEQNRMTGRGEYNVFPRMTNHEICHEMFWNAFRGRSKMYIQMQDLRYADDDFSCVPGETTSNRTGWEDRGETIVIQCSLLTLQMLDYDVMMFRAMGDTEDRGYRNASRHYYRPYFFSYIAEVGREEYRKLQELQRKQDGQEDLLDERGRRLPHQWLACTFSPDAGASHVRLRGYAVQSASRIEKIRADLHVIEDERTPRTMVRSILDGYETDKSWLQTDDSFISLLANRLGQDCLSAIDVYRIGNGNCVFAQGMKGSMGFFYDIGFHYRHRPRKVTSWRSSPYHDTMQKIYARKPSFFILSHWDMDHIAGSAAAGKGFLDKDWFAPDCHDACIDAKRLARYLGLKGCLYLAQRCLVGGKNIGRLIGQPIRIMSAASPFQPLATYRIYMGEKADCDKSAPNCEGIVIEYMDIQKDKRILMMGDVNYASFNKARFANGDPLFADTRIDYLVVPHHGSEHTGYAKITEPGKSPRKGCRAVICCTDDPGCNRPNEDHRTELRKRFGAGVLTTEHDSSADKCVRITP